MCFEYTFLEHTEYKRINDPSIEWRETNVEWSYTVLAQLESDYPAAKPVSVLFKHGGLTPRFNEDHIVFHGSEGSIYIKGHYGSGPLYLWGKDKQWQEVELPEDIAKSLPDIQDDTQRSWTHLACEFVKDLNGESVAPYQTFEDGCRYQKIIDLIRNSNSLHDVTHL